MNQKRFTEGKAHKSGFYVALAVCLAAVGIAAWSTYDSVNSYLEPAEASSLTEQQEEEVRQGQETDAQPESSSQEEAPAVSQEDRENAGVDQDDPEAPRASSAPAEETAGQVSQEPEETPSSESSPEPAQTEDQVPATAPLYEISDEMIWPLESRQASKAYSAGTPVYSETMKDWRIHTGLDVAAQNEEPVLACANGLVKETYSDSMLGNVVLIEHGDYLFSYCGVGENFLVQPGEVVSMGQQIGVVTAVPFEAAEETHLHLEVRRDGAALDPQAVLEG